MLQKLYTRLVAKKAGSIYANVTAASICDKVTRDVLLKDWKFMETGFDAERSFGCGYPSGPKTVVPTDDRLLSRRGLKQKARLQWRTHKKGRWSKEEKG